MVDVIGIEPTTSSFVHIGAWRSVRNSLVVRLSHTHKIKKPYLRRALKFWT